MHSLAVAVDVDGDGTICPLSVNCNQAEDGDKKYLGESVQRMCIPFYSCSSAGSYTSAGGDSAIHKSPRSLFIEYYYDNIIPEECLQQCLIQ